MLVEPESRICCSLAAATENGTSCSAVARFCAVTTTSSIGSASLDGVAAVAIPDMVTSKVAARDEREIKLLPEMHRALLQWR